MHAFEVIGMIVAVIGLLYLLLHAIAMLFLSFLTVNDEKWVYMILAGVFMAIFVLGSMWLLKSIDVTIQIH